MKVRCEYCAGPELKFLSNLDMMHMMERALRRAEIPYALSEGFNPHIKLSMGTVLPVGLWGKNEYFDLELTKNVAPEWFVMQLNSVLPAYIKINRMIEIDSKEPALMKTVNAAGYSFVVKGVSQSELQQQLDNLIKMPVFLVKSRGKKKDVDKDLKPGIYKIEVKGQEDSVIINLTVAIGEPVNIRFDELKDLLLSAGIREENLTDVYRKANYIKIEENYFTPLEKVV
ncbi:MAG TPA: TIGR03936 family radical SAM-associated protein [Syntrophomonadaceae bacterium]|nr:TIGR03936 family radical SAM-associated protein [Syntrophomonadaceae bacterium]HPR92470.1 TIGR03936 family radical SAM-associated protein [Syntrophomonadaceae bacterium]